MCASIGTYLIPQSVHDNLNYTSLLRILEKNYHRQIGLSNKYYFSPNMLTFARPSVSPKNLGKAITHVALDHQTYSALDQHTQITWTAQLKCDEHSRVGG